MNETVNIFIGPWDSFCIFVMGVWDTYPGELVLFGIMKEWTDAEDAENEFPSESSGVRGVVTE